MFPCEFAFERERRFERAFFQTRTCSKQHWPFKQHRYQALTTVTRHFHTHVRFQTRRDALTAQPSQSRCKHLQAVVERISYVHSAAAVNGQTCTRIEQQLSHTNARHQQQTQTNTDRHTDPWATGTAGRRRRGSPTSA